MTMWFIKGATLAAKIVWAHALPLFLFNVFCSLLHPTMAPHQKIGAASPGLVTYEFLHFIAEKTIKRGKKPSLLSGNHTLEGKEREREMMTNCVDAIVVIHVGIGRR